MISETEPPEKILYNLSIPILEIRFTKKDAQALNINVVEAQL
jgi:hypothetical protein